jgi:hypothetical protein
MAYYHEQNSLLKDCALEMRALNAPVIHRLFDELQYAYDSCGAQRSNGSWALKLDANQKTDLLTILGTFVTDLTGLTA